MRSCNVEDRRREGLKIQLFGIFWLFFWTILPYVFTYSTLPLQNTPSISLLIAIPGSIVSIAIGRWSSHINVRQEWEDLSDAQKALDMKRTRFEEQQKSFHVERERLSQYDEELRRRKEDLIVQNEELERRNYETQRQQKELKKQHKGLQKIQDDTTCKIKDMETQQIEIKKARDELEKTWSELEDAVKKKPFKLFIKEKLKKEIFIQEIEELKMTKPGDVLFISTEADKAVLNIREELKREIENTEDEYYYEAFLEHFKKTNGDKTEYDRIRIKYNPTIHVQSDRRNKEWAERRRFDLSKIEKLSIKEKKSIGITCEE
jgi:chromosome segregation ATPase